MGEVTMTSSAAAPRVVVGVDGSSSSYAAVRWAVRQAELIGGAVDVVYAWDTPSAVGWAGPAVDPTFDLEQAREQFAAELRAALADPPPVEVREHLVEGDPSDVLIRAAEDAELLVVGRRGRGAFTRALLGSVSQRCAQHASCPVVVVRPDHEPEG
ncbi:universal stress protein [Streptomyces triticagri]|uniref:Universal stress protein n=1 Tax=Streptomyces triticagri TaxID=2293568 RepID=A0A372M0U9_9ACTN|nr:universal stress protein [Streptomyces triticagri]RFU84556.1 universal stress protein [Streptomyces triticagri]